MTACYKNENYFSVEKNEEEIDIKNLPRAQTTIDVIWDQFG